MSNPTATRIAQLEEKIERGRQIQRELRSRRSWALLLLFLSLLALGMGLFMPPLRLLLIVGVIGLIVSLGWRRQLIPISREIDEGMVAYRTELAREQADLVQQALRQNRDP